MGKAGVSSSSSKVRKILRSMDKAIIVSLGLYYGVLLEVALGRGRLRWGRAGCSEGGRAGMVLFKLRSFMPDIIKINGDRSAEVPQSSCSYAG